MTSDFFIRGVTLLVPLLLSLTVHEYSHAWSAYRLGDDTAARMGRLTLNPFVHADLIGTILLPLLGIPFGWAKPVPINPARFRRGVRMSTGMVITAAAGPLSNVVLAVLAVVGLGLIARFSVVALQPGSGVPELLLRMVQINVALAVFNLIPIPPLDGSRIVDGLVPLRFRPAWETFTRLSPFLLLAVFFGAQYIMAGPIGFANDMLSRLFRVVAS